VGESSFWYRPTRVVPDQRPLNGRCCCCIPIYLFSEIFSGVSRGPICSSCTRAHSPVWPPLLGTLGVVHKGRPQRGGVGWLRYGQMRTRGMRGVDCMQLSISLLAMLACSCTALLVTPAVTALAVLSGPLRTGIEPANTSSEGKLRGQFRIPISENGSVSSGPTT